MISDRYTYAHLSPPPFVEWLHSHGLIHPGCSWSCTTDLDGEPVFRRRGDPGKAWPADRIAGALVVRPKRKALELV